MVYLTHSRYHNMANYTVIDSQTGTIIGFEHARLVDMDELSEESASKLDYGSDAEINEVAIEDGHAISDYINLVDQVWSLMKNSPDWNTDTINSIVDLMAQNGFNSPASD